LQKYRFTSQKYCDALQKCRIASQKYHGLLQEFHLLSHKNHFSFHKYRFPFRKYCYSVHKNLLLLHKYITLLQKNSLSVHKYTLFGAEIRLFEILSRECKKGADTWTPSTWSLICLTISWAMVIPSFNASSLDLAARIRSIISFGTDTPGTSLFMNSAFL
jgi:hypothetical protein